MGGPCSGPTRWGRLGSGGEVADDFLGWRCFFFLRFVVFYIHLVYFSFFKAGFCCFSLLFSDCVSKMWSVSFIEIDK